uniref:Sulfotransferase domain-containing protein n=2 Tax=Ixodes scapularis TaxID=6945 RepID=A0A1S4LGF3_IXOSC
TFAEFSQSVPILELNSRETVARTRLLRTHLPMNRMRFSDEAKYVYVARNPWDCCVSDFHVTKDFPVFEFEKGKFEDFLDAFLRGQAGFGDYFDHVVSGYARKDCLNVLFLTYEEIQKNKTDVILRLANFLGDAYGAALKKTTGQHLRGLWRSAN